MLKLPPFGAGQRIGLFGGSFNPAHRGHYMVALYAMKRLKLDFVWWIVSPQNPLKDPKDTGDYDKRLAYARQIAKHPRFIVTDIERQMRSKYTADTFARLKQHLSHAKCVWIMGADSLANLHHWHDWTDILDDMPLAVLARPGYSIRALGSPAATRLRRFRFPSHRATLVPGAKPPALVFVSMPLRKESSTAIRKRRKAKALKQSAPRSKKDKS